MVNHISAEHPKTKIVVNPDGSRVTIGELTKADLGMEAPGTTSDRPNPERDALKSHYVKKFGAQPGTKDSARVSPPAPQARGLE